MPSPHQRRLQLPQPRNGPCTYRLHLGKDAHSKTAQASPAQPATNVVPIRGQCLSRLALRVSYLCNGPHRVRLPTRLHNSSFHTECRNRRPIRVGGSGSFHRIPRSGLVHVPRAPRGRSKARSRPSSACAIPSCLPWLPRELRDLENTGRGREEVLRVDPGNRNAQTVYGGLFTVSGVTKCRFT